VASILSSFDRFGYVFEDWLVCKLTGQSSGLRRVLIDEIIVFW